LEALQTLTDIAIQKKEYDQASAYAERQLAIDNLNENAHRQMMEVLALAGRRVEALRQYRQFVHLLDDELGVPPSSDTTALYERIQAEGLPSDPAKLAESKSEDTFTPRHNLPPQPTPFIGREAELADLDRFIADPGIRLITIVAPGGMGKTRLAIACAERQLEPIPGDEDSHSFTDGIFFAPLEALDSPDQIPKEIATALDLDLNPGGMMGQRGGAVDPKQHILEYLQQKQLLIVLDNFEQLIDGAMVLADLLQSAPSIQILVTSRERLNLQEEQVFPITGLTFPIDEAAQDPCDYTAIQLFQERAQRVRPDFEFTSDDLVYLTRICRLVDGMPLGLELAASWIDLLSVKEISAEIQRSIDFLKTDLVNIPERHRSLTAVCNSTWEYLSDTERDDFARLSVFRGGFTRSAAEQVAGTSLRSLVTLVKKSLLQFDATGERYRFHPYLRQFTSEKLTAQPDDEFKVRDAHSAYFIAELDGHQQTLEGGQPHIALDRTEKELTNILEAWDWAVNNGNFFRVDIALDGICSYYDWCDRYDVGLLFCQTTLNKLRQVDSGYQIDPDLTDRVHLKIILWQGYYNLAFQNERATQFFEQAEQMIDKLNGKGFDARAEKCHLLFYQGILNNWTSGYKNAQDSFKEALAVGKEIDQNWMVLECLNMLGKVADRSGSLAEAKAWYKRYLVEA
jgi:predicted ATPase